MVDALPEYEIVKSFSITATAFDATGLVEVELWFKKNGGPWTHYGDVTASPWTWEFNTSGTGGDGAYEFYTLARDVVDNSEDEPAWADTTTIVDTIIPALGITSPQDGEWVTQKSINVQWTGADGGSGIDFYEVKMDDGVWINMGTVANRLYPNVIDGPHNTTVRVHDKAGHSRQASLSFGVDSTKPVVRIDSPEDGSAETSSTIKVTWTGSDAASGIDHYEVKINGRGFTNVGLETSHEFEGVGDGGHYIIVRALDVAGNLVDVKSDIHVDTNPLSPGGPFMGVPLYVLIVVVGVLLLLFFMKWRRRGEEEPAEEKVF
jgi:hypothetical protein